jgi:hypothetical protein
MNKGLNVYETMGNKKIKLLEKILKRDAFIKKIVKSQRLAWITLCDHN